MERREVMTRAATWVQARGWREKLAKRRAYEQSLFEHSLMELDVLLELLPILDQPRHYGLSDVEKQILVVAVLAHDAGKETDAWQAYVRDPRAVRWVAHVIPELTRAIVPELCIAVGFENLVEPVQRIMAHCADFHHARPGRSDGAIMEAILTGGSDRFLTLAHLVRSIDHVCSASSAAEAEDTVRDDPALGPHLKVTRHEVAVRGVSTTFLHRAAQEAFQRRGWRTLLYFPNATLYAADPNDGSAEPAIDEIRAILKTGVDGAIARDVASLMVGSPTANILPKPEILSFTEFRQYLRSAASKVSPQSFARKPLSKKRKVVEEYWKLKGKVGRLTDDEVEAASARISVAQPEMMVFKFFKAMMDPRKVPAVGDDGATLAKARYEMIFGAGSWAALQATSTIMPARDMANTVDYFWSLPGAAVGRPEVARVAELPDQVRLGVLIDVLDSIAQQVYATIGRCSPRDGLSQAMAEAFLRDLVRPTDLGDVRTLAQDQLEHYAHSKPFAGKVTAKGVYLCPICNSAFELKDGVKASADFIDKPESHTNRGVAHGRFGYIMVCQTCYYERILYQILLGDRPQEIITLFPRLNLGPGRGEHLVHKVREWVEAAKAQMRGEVGSAELGFSLGFTEQAARKVGERDPFTLGAVDLMELFNYRYRPETRDTRRREALRRLKEEFGHDLNALNAAIGQAFANWEEAVRALEEGRVAQQEFLTIRRDVFRLKETIGLVCQTPNLVFIPLSYEVAAGDDESDASKALRRLYVTIVLSLVFDSAVAITRPGEPLDLRTGTGSAYVPPVPAVRALTRSDWLSIAEAEAWLIGIGAASMLLRDTGLPVRSALLQILTADPPERIARRIESQPAGQGTSRSLTLKHVKLIEQLREFQQLLRKEVPA